MYNINTPIGLNALPAVGEKLTGIGFLSKCVRRRLVTGLAGAFVLMTAILVVGGVVYSPAFFLLAIVFGGVSYVMYAHATGRLLRRIYRGVERQAATTGSDPGAGGFGAGPRSEWRPPRQEQRRRARRDRVGRRSRGRAGSRRRPPRQEGPSTREAHRILGVEPGADEGTVKQAYRERIKEVHPDASGGDEAAFKRVRAAYEVLSD